ncbi:MAG: GntR family transcriptional regulator [Saprospiraceae bacterium]|nr:MAG: GntR family transcriptional regulator [Saprospiraceae bacterium]
MLTFGKFNTMTATRRTGNGMYLTDKEKSREVLLPNKYVPGDLEPGGKIRAFVFNDSEDRPTATTVVPKVQLHEFAVLQVRQVTKVGAFLDWGLEKDLLVPFKEQPGRMLEGHWYMIYLYLDEETTRLSASGRYQKFLENEAIAVQEGEEVNVLIDDESNLGVNVIINNRYRGLIYENELFKKVRRGDRLKGYIKTVREDGKIDVRLERQGFGRVKTGAPLLLEKLEENGGFLPLTDKSSPDAIATLLEMSKKTFKKTAGTLYKQRLIRLESDGIYLAKKNGPAS